MSGSCQSRIGAALYRNPSPSASVYLEWSCADLIADGSLERLSPTVFRCGDAIVVIRHLSGLSRLPEIRRLIYVIDDDWRAGIADGSLPWLYRAQLRSTLARVAPELERRATTIAVSSQVLLARYRQFFPDKVIELLEPVWPRAAGDTASEKPRRVAYLSAWSHVRDFEFLKPVLFSLVRDRPGCVFTLTENARIPRSWRRQRNVETVPAMPWPEYAAWICRQSFDVALYPLLDGPFNAARSRNKLLELDQCGAAILASANWEAAPGAAASGRCIAVSDTIENWRNELMRLLDAKGYAAGLSRKNRAHIVATRPLESQRRVWKRLLANDLSVVSTCN